MQIRNTAAAICFFVLSAITTNAQAPVWDNMGSGFDMGGTTLLMWNGNLYAGGYFTQAGSAGAAHVARWNGQSWSALGQGLNATVTCLAVYNNELYAAGNFTSSGSTICPHIAKWNGTSWENVGGGVFGTAVYGMTEYNGMLYVTGKFHQAGSTTAYNVAAWDGTSWHAVGASGFNRHPFYYGMCMEVWNGKLYVGGLIDSVDNMEIGYIAEWDGSNWNTLQHGLNGPVNALESYNGLLYAGGWFTATWWAQQRLFYLASWNGNNWSPVGTGVNNGVLTLFGYGNELYAGGWFYPSPTVPDSFLTAWNGSAFVSVGQPSAVVRSVCGDEGIIYATGDFDSVDNAWVHHVAKYAAVGVGISPAGNTMPVSVAPNPSTAVFHFTTSAQDENRVIEIYSAQGMLVRRIEFEDETATVDLTNEASGIYFYRVMNDKTGLCAGRLIRN